MGLSQLKYLGAAGFELALAFAKVKNFLLYNRKSDIQYINERFENAHQYKLNLAHPKSLNEKLQWLKLNDRRQLLVSHADKFGVREYVEKEFGAEFLIPLILISENVDEIVPENLPDESVIIKTTHDSGSFHIVQNKKQTSWTKIKSDLKWALRRNYYWIDREWQYGEIKPRIIVEKLLQDDGKIPNDYKFNCFNGKVEFIYVSVDREGINKRNIYSRDWQPLPFTWSKKYKDHSTLRGPEIDPPLNLAKMIEMAEHVAQQYDYVRVDMYNINGAIYFGEITHCHGGGFDEIRPLEWDFKLGEKLVINESNK
jgi:hypothetical protein